MKIGIYRSCGIGDVVQLTPLFQQIRADFPAAHIAFFTSENVAGVVAGCPWLDRADYFASTVVTGAAARWGGLPIWSRIAREGRWDLFIDLDPQWRRSMGFPLVRTGRSAGLQTSGWKPLRLFDEFLTLHPQGLDRGHTSARYLELWQKLTRHPDRGYGYSLRYPPGNSEFPEVPPRAVCLVPGAGNPMNPGDAKRWPLDRWVKLSELLAADGYKPLWLGSAEDARQFPIPGAHRSYMGQLDLPTVWRVIDRSSALIGNDSGLFHLALTTQARAVALFGPTNPQRTGPFRNPNTLVLKAGIGVVEDRWFHDSGPGPTRDALDRFAPMHLLEFEEVARAVTAFLSHPARP